MDIDKLLRKGSVMVQKSKSFNIHLKVSAQRANSFANVTSLLVRVTLGVRWDTL